MKMACGCIALITCWVLQKKCPVQFDYYVTKVQIDEFVHTCKTISKALSFNDTLACNKIPMQETGLLALLCNDYAVSQSVVFVETPLLKHPQIKLA